MTCTNVTQVKHCPAVWCCRGHAKEPHSIDSICNSDYAEHSIASDFSECKSLASTLKPVLASLPPVRGVVAEVSRRAIE